MVSYMLRRVWLATMAFVCTGACTLSIHGELVDCNVVTNDLFSMIAFGASHACATRYRTGRVLCWNQDNMTDTINQENTTDTTNHASDTIKHASVAPTWIHHAHSLSLGANHSCALWGKLDTLTCWGGDIGISSPVNVSHNVRMLAVGHPRCKHVCFLLISKMSVSCVGDNSLGQLGLGAAGSDILTVAAERRARY